MTLCIPVTNKDCNIFIWQQKRYCNNFSVVNGDSTVSSCSSLEVLGREVKETPNLILYLKFICPVPTSRNRTISPRYTILPRVLSMLYSIPALSLTHVSIHFFTTWRGSYADDTFILYIPCEKQRLIKVILDIDNNIPVCSDV